MLYNRTRLVVHDADLHIMPTWLPDRFTPYPPARRAIRGFLAAAGIDSQARHRFYCDNFVDLMGPALEPLAG